MVESDPQKKGKTILKIIYLSYTYWPPDFGGDLSITLERFESLTKRGHNILVLTSGKPNCSKTRYERGYEVRCSPSLGNSRLHRGLRRILFWIWGILQLIVQDYEVLHLGSMPGFGSSSSAIMAWTFGLISRMKNSRCLSVYSLADPGDSPINLEGMQRYWKKVNFANLDQIVAVSPVLYKTLRDFMPEKVIFLPYGIRDDLFHPLELNERQILRAQDGVSEDEVIFVFLGTVGYRKGFDLLANAFATLAPDHPLWRLWVIGPYRFSENQNLREDEVKSVTKPLDNLGNQVKFWGRIDNRERLAELMGLCDIFVFPSRREGFGIAPLEAMSTGLPVLMSRIEGITDLANIAGETGLYIKVGHANELREAMLQLGENTELRRVMGLRARKRIEGHFGWEQHLDAWEQLYAGEFKGI